MSARPCGRMAPHGRSVSSMSALYCGRWNIHRPLSGGYRESVLPAICSRSPSASYGHFSGRSEQQPISERGSCDSRATNISRKSTESHPARNPPAGDADPHDVRVPQEEAIDDAYEDIPERYTHCEWLPSWGRQLLERGNLLADTALALPTLSKLESVLRRAIERCIGRPCSDDRR